MIRKKLIATAVAAAIVGMSHAALAQTYNGALNTGPSTTTTPYVQGVTGFDITSIFTVGDTVGGYKMVGIPDGLGAYDNGNGTFTLLMNHELGNTVGVARAHGGIGAFVSKWVIDTATLTVQSGSDLITTVNGWSTGLQATSGTLSNVSFNRFCSADLPVTTAFYNAASGLGSQEKIFMHGEEGGATGWQMATVATGASAGNSYILGKFNLTTNGSGLTGVGAWENALANPYAQDKTIVVGTNDGGSTIMNNSVAVYVGTKTNTGSEIDKAGLTNGTLKFVNVTGNPVEITNSTTRATGITNGSAFTLSSTASTTFSRPEDGVWSKDGSKFYFVTTDRIDQVADGVGTQVGKSRLWRLSFNDITNPDAGGTIDMLLDGAVADGAQSNMFDNLSLNVDGTLTLQEDVGNAAHNGKMWQYDPATGQLKLIARSDPARFGNLVGGVTTPATSPFNQDEETSGIIDVTDIFDPTHATGKKYQLFVMQAHSTTGQSAETVEGGQLMLLTAPVPEPETYALMLAGLGLLGFARRRKNSKQQ